MSIRGWVLAVIALCGVAGSAFLAELHVDTRRDMLSQRRLMRSEGTSIALKNRFFKQALAEARAEGDLSMASVALRMNRHEGDYRLPYVWGGSIKNYAHGLDCTGLIHGLMYYLGYSHYSRRFNTNSLYFKLRADREWITLFDSARMPGKRFDPALLAPGDIIVWPSGVDDGKNLPGAIWGHVGVVTGKGELPLMVTHYVQSEAYDRFDQVGLPGPGINTLPANDFIRLKQRGVMGVFRPGRALHTATANRMGDKIDE